MVLAGKKFFIIGWSIFLIVLFFGHASAYSLSVDPEEIRFPKVLRKGFAQDYLLITTDSTEPVRLVFSIAGPIKDWISLEKQTQVSQNKSKRIKVTVRTPPDISPGWYEGYIIFSPVLAKNKLTSSDLSSYSVKVIVELTQQEIKQALVRDIWVETENTKKNSSLILLTEIENQGNVVIEPDVSIEILDKDKKSLALFNHSLISDPCCGKILPTATETFASQFNLPSHLPLGNYWARILVSLNQLHLREQLIPFEILENDSLFKAGELKELSYQQEASPGTEVKINSLFKNRGRSEIEAKFKANIYLDDILVERIESPTQLVKNNQSVNLSASFTPEKPGFYKIMSYVIYEDRITEIKESSLEIKENLEPIPLSLDFLAVPLLLLFLGAIILIMKKYH